MTAFIEGQRDAFGDETWSPCIRHKPPLSFFCISQPTDAMCRSGYAPTSSGYVSKKGPERFLAPALQNINKIWL
jgi:hypothetical protein